MKQRFQRGDLVRTSQGTEGIVLGSYRDLFGGAADGYPCYTLHIRETGPCSWYYQNELTLIEKDREDLLRAWRTREPSDSTG